MLLIHTCPSVCPLHACLILTWYPAADLLKPQYNDNELEYDETIYQTLLGKGIYTSHGLHSTDIVGLGFDELLAKHFAHLFIRDPIVVYKQLIDQDDTLSTDHFEVRCQPFAALFKWPARIFNQPTGRQCASSRLRLTAPLVRRLHHDHLG